MRRLLTFLFAITAASAALPAQTRTIGLITHDEGRTSPGFTLLAPKHNGRTYLIDNYGQVYKTWDSKYEPGQSAYLLPNGRMMRAAMAPGSGSLGTGGGEGGRLEEYDWDGNLTWEFDYMSSTYAIHHDFKVLPSGNIIALLVERKTQAEVLAAGFNPSLLTDTFLLPDAIVEIEPIRPKGGRVVWEWHVWDHLIQNFDHAKNNYGDPAAHPELVDPNASPRKLATFWNHMNSIDYNAEFDQIALSVRGNSEAWVIDHSTTTAQAAGHAGGKYGKGGDPLYRWGNPQMYYAGKSADQMLYEQHDVQWIEPGRTGAGDMLVFNNGVNRPGGNYSSADEFTPAVDAGGNYTLTAGASSPKQLTWTYAGLKGAGWYESDISGAYRLPNGNTLLCYGTHGALVEVAAGGEIVWQYVNPVTNTGPMVQGATSGLDDRGHNLNAVFRVRRYPPDYAGLAGQTLTPKGVIEISAPSFVNAASYKIGPGAPGSILTIFSDSMMADTEGSASSSTLPTKLAGVSVEIKDSAGATQTCGLFYVSPRQINVKLPVSLALGQATVTVRRDSGVSVSGTLTIESVAPGLFTLGSSSVGAIIGLRVDAAGQRSDVATYQYDAAKGQFAAAAIDLGPATDQVYLSLYGTGMRGFSSISAISCAIGGAAVPVSGAAAHSIFAGLDQVNVGPLPRTLAGKGEASLVLTIDGKTTNAVTVNVK